MTARHEAERLFLWRRDAFSGSGGGSWTRKRLREDGEAVRPSTDILDAPVIGLARQGLPDVTPGPKSIEIVRARGSQLSGEAGSRGCAAERSDCCL